MLTLWLVIWAQTSPSSAPDLIATYGAAGVTIGFMAVVIRVLWKENVALRAEITKLNTDAVTRADRTAPLLADTIRILDERERPAPPARRRTSNG